jgi:hypothetical protein
MNLQDARLHQRHHAADILDEEHFLFAAFVAHRVAQDEVGQPRPGMLLEKAALLRARRATH